ncbi:hypothetical protein [Halobacterium noricense]|uniref:hypothetical protein n=1 Tax=Halobacterium noricense TaxID=223182 RepID=UPI001E497DBE|nr:hypothetical protein [Halobacterium noricense]UHH25619.1 hypothetical protein LT974_01445 [Halobacterium noricense]
MNRRNFVKSMAVVPLTPSVIPEFGDTESERENWSVRGVWRREDDTGHLAIRLDDDHIEKEFETYNDWVTETIQESSEKSDLPHTVDLFDFSLVSLYNGSYSRSHFSHECGLEVTIKRDPTEEEEYTAVVRHVGESWDERRMYSSSAQIAIASKCKQELEEYL